VIRRLAASVLALALVGACRPDRVRMGPPARDSGLQDVPVRGHLVRIERSDDLPALVGELIAAGQAGLWVWTGSEAISGAAGSHPRIAHRNREDPAEHVLVPTASIRRVVVSRYHAGRALAATGGWAGGVVLLTLTHGFIFVITMPITAVAGAGALVGTHVQSKVYVHRGLGARREALGERLSALRGFARFPQGVPPQWPTPGEGAEAPPASDPPPASEPLPEDAEPTASPPEPAPSDAPDSDAPADPDEPASEVPEPPAP
jgi:hypothetical protein